MKPLLYSICLMLLIDGINSGLLFPILPELFMNRKLGLKIDNICCAYETLYSLTLALFPLSSMVGMPILGALSDRYEKSKIILYGLIGLVMNSLLSIAAIATHNIWLFLLSICLSGFLSGTYAVGNALISYISDNEQDRMNNFKLPMLASMLGFILGPGLSICISQINMANPLIIPFVIVCILSIANLLLLWNSFRKINIKYHMEMTPNKSCFNLLHALRSIATSLTYIFGTPYLIKLAFSYLLFMLGFGLFVESLSLYLAYNHSYTPNKIGIFFIVMFITMAMSMYSLQKLMVKYITYKTQIKLSLLVTALLLIFGSISRQIISCLSVTDHLYITWIIAILFYIFTPFSTLGFTNLFAGSVSKESQGKIIGSSGQIASMGFFIAGLFIGKLMILNCNLILLLSGISLMLSYIVLENFTE
ncbi:MFS transporter [Cardinium endosymbiont of Oedothorax gibbosus]|uniref:MFS transporter n=1 Tax=Cardinium endosymbiont of Oedothorax gibbosus TaxID=931101 RepID=UPI00202569C2|nr:MFS transporter [Cardinium endosymbiont of Oedothorax gibbosus]CAH2559756.1 Major facilitator superfamily protein [Cardinium endosymbiont of Oedothorax gibbosus]